MKRLQLFIYATILASLFTTTVFAGNIDFQTNGNITFERGCGQITSNGTITFERSSTGNDGLLKQCSSVDDSVSQAAHGNIDFSLINGFVTLMLATF